jgi:hypothetical protein
VTEQDTSPEPGTEPEDVGNRLMQTVAWFAIAAVAVLVIALCALVLYAMGIF